MIELGLTGEVFEYHGAHYRQPPTAINVRCIQQPLPPIWMASGDHAVNGRAARHGYTPFVSSRFANQEELAPIREHIAQSFRREGRRDRPMPLGILSYGCVSESKRDIARYADAARFQQRIARSLRERREQVERDHSITPVPFAGEPSLDAIEANILCGDPETVAERLVEFIRIVHPTHMLFYFQVGGYESAKAIRSMELWAERVVPMVERALGMSIGEIEGAPP